MFRMALGEVQQLSTYWQSSWYYRSIVINTLPFRYAILKPFKEVTQNIFLVG